MFDLQIVNQSERAGYEERESDAAVVVLVTKFLMMVETIQSGTITRSLGRLKCLTTATVDSLWHVADIVCFVVDHSIVA